MRKVGGEGVASPTPRIKLQWREGYDDRANGKQVVLFNGLGEQSLGGGSAIGGGVVKYSFGIVDKHKNFHLQFPGDSSKQGPLISVKGSTGRSSMIDEDKVT